ncbi:hypothetical protein [Fodinibius saliphilus]|uniref:hypothetical protein n=1 Tax=Fodinibius saliphilus TaxID=1920650 RepID=UPI001107D7AD|nr:hypothetical protein [Fodinibius saliphilus]
MMQELGQFLMENGFEWKKRTSFFQRIYFAKQGTINFYLVNLDQTHFSEKKKERFIELLHVFSEQYQFPMQANSNFAQCAPITFTDSQDSQQQTNK